MYPLNTARPWPTRQWYVAGFSEEFGSGLVGRKFLDQETVLFRDSSGRVRALSGVCPHRMMPLRKGRLIGEHVECAYHGLTFSADGECVAAPTSSVLPRCRLGSFPVIERPPLVWIWMDDASAADTAVLPDQTAAGLGGGGWTWRGTHHYVLGARYALLVDNLFDLSHLGFIHASILGGGGISLADAEIQEVEGRLVVAREAHDVPSSAYHRMLHPELGERMSNRLVTDMIGLSLINAGGCAWAGRDCSGPPLGRQNFVHAITPETAGTTHYWILIARDFRRDDAELTDRLATQNRAVVDQDVAALEAIERVIASAHDLPREISMKSDLGALSARRRIIEMIRREAPAET